MWRLNPRTLCDLITALSSQIPLIVSLKKRFAKFINRCLSSHNTTLQFISCVAINNPISRTGTNYRDLLNYHGILNSNNGIQSEWSKKLIPLHNDVKTLQELIEIRDGIKNASVSLKKTSVILLQTYALNNVCFIYLFIFYIDMYLFFLNIYYICTFANITIVVLLSSACPGGALEIEKQKKGYQGKF